MPTLHNISGNTAEIYEASLLYEQNGKCGETIILAAGESWDSTTDSDTKVWKIVSLFSDSSFDAFAANNITVANCAKLLVAHQSYIAGVEIMADITYVECSVGCWILYKDCPQS